MSDFFNGFIAGIVFTATLLAYYYKAYMHPDSYYSTFSSNDKARKDLLSKAQQDGTPSRKLSRSSNLRERILNTLPKPASDAKDSTLDNLHSDGFLSDIVKQLWPHMSTAVAHLVKEMVEPMFASMLPKPLNTMKFTKLDFGNKAVRLENLIVHEYHKKDEMLQFDVDVIWDGNDVDIQCKADFVGKLGVKALHLNGRMCFICKPLTNMLPIVSAVQYTFINQPSLKLDFTGLANLADVKLFKSNVDKIIADLLKSTIVLPQRMNYKMDCNTSFIECYHPPKYFLRVTVIEGKNFPIEKRSLHKQDIPDCYNVVTLGDKTWRTSTRKDNVDPVWNEASDFVLCDAEQIINIHVWDEDLGKLDPDDDLGQVSVTVRELLLSHGQRKCLELHDNKQQSNGATVTIKGEVAAVTTNLDSLNDPLWTNIADEDQCCVGLLTILVTQAFNLPVKKEKAYSCVRVQYGSFEFVTGVVSDYPGYDPLNPLYDCAFLVPLTPALVKAKNEVHFSLMNSNHTLETTKVKHDDIINAPDYVLKEKRRISHFETKDHVYLEFCVMLHGIDRKGAPKQKINRNPKQIESAEKDDEDNKATEEAEATDSSKSEHENDEADGDVSEGSLKRQQEAQIRITVIEGKGFKLEKKRLHRRDHPDVYCHIRYGSSPQVWRTNTISDDVNPKWHDSRDFPWINAQQLVKVDVWNANRHGKDGYFGEASIPVGKLLMAPKGTEEVEIMCDNKSTGYYITLQCQQLE